MLVLSEWVMGVEGRGEIPCYLLFPLQAKNLGLVNKLGEKYKAAG